MRKQKDKPNGTKERPFAFENVYLDEVTEDGIYVGYFLEHKFEDGWELWSGRVQHTEQSAFAEMKKAIRNCESQDKERARRNHFLAFPTQQDAQILQYKVKRGTANKTIDGYAIEMKQARDRLKGTIKAPKFVWERPDYESEFRVVKRTLTLRSEILHEPTKEA